MTQADSAKALRRSLDSQAGGHATTSPRLLPDGWTWFQSVAHPGDRGRYYATAPYDAFPVSQRAGKIGTGLYQTVDAPTLEKLVERVVEQVALYERLTAG